MRITLKMLRANDERKTRFHTERGQLLPLTSWPSAFQSALRRFAHHRSDLPWMTPSAVKYLDSVIQPCWSVFEFGSGASTSWFAKRTRSVVSVEDNAFWHAQVLEQMAIEGIDNCKIELLDTPEAFPSYIENFADDAFDLVIIDGHEAWPGHRLDCVMAARKKIKPGGIIVLDDSDRVEYRGADDFLRGWPVMRMIGIKPFPLMAVETSIYYRPRVS